MRPVLTTSMTKPMRSPSTALQLPSCSAVPYVEAGLRVRRLGSFAPPHAHHHALRGAVPSIGVAGPSTAFSCDPLSL
jgi:hypothetical protein